MAPRRTDTNRGGAPRQSRRVNTSLRVILAGLLFAGLVAPVSSAETPEWSEAAWADSEVAEGTFKAITVPVPEGVDCAYNPGLLGLLLPSVTLQWRVAGGGVVTAPYTVEPGFQTAGVISSLLDGLLATISTTQNGSVYTTKATALLATNLFGSSRNLGVRVLHPSGWSSSWLVGTATSQSLGTNGSCTFKTISG